MDDFEVPEGVEDLVTGLAVVAAGTLVRAAMDKLFEHGAKRPPPRDPGEPGVSWREALAWASAVGVAVAVTRVITRRFMSRR